jgi:hypothetical protein
MQDTIALGAVLLAVLYVVRRGRSLITAQGPRCCDGCADCAALSKASRSSCKTIRLDILLRPERQ